MSGQAIAPPQASYSTALMLTVSQEALLCPQSLLFSCYRHSDIINIFTMQSIWKPKIYINPSLIHQKITIFADYLAQNQHMTIKNISFIKTAEQNKDTKNPWNIQIKNHHESLYPSHMQEKQDKPRKQELRKIQTWARQRVLSTFSMNLGPNSLWSTSLRRLWSSLQSSSKLWNDISSAMSSVVSAMVYTYSFCIYFTAVEERRRKKSGWFMVRV